MGAFAPGLEPVRYDTVAYYDRIAKQWHEATGYNGGSFKRHVLNDVLLQKISGFSDRAILELGAGNGYFLPLALQRFSGQLPRRIVISDASDRLLSIAESHFSIAGAEYLPLDVRSPFPFEDESFDLILATMVFNEVSTGGMKRALRECHRVQRPEGLFLMTITHPEFIDSLNRRKLLKKERNGLLTMPASGQMRLPIMLRSLEQYQRLLRNSGYTWERTDVYASEKVFHEKPGLREAGNQPLGLVLACHKLDGV